MPDPDSDPGLNRNGTFISPAIDDELVFTVRIRVEDQFVLDRVQSYLLDTITARLHNGISEVLNRPGLALAGIEIVTPTFRPYHTVYQRNAEPLPESG